MAVDSDRHRQLIVNADDLGQSDQINVGIIEAAEAGIVTSASMMVRWAAHHDAARWARGRTDVTIGLHLDLGEWIASGGEWTALYEVVNLDDLDAVRDEIDLQIRSFERAMGRTPTHLDSHQHVHLTEPVRSLFADVARRLGVPLRSLSQAAYCGAFYGQWGAGDSHPESITFEALLAILDDLPPGVSELACHPASDNVDDVVSMYLLERGTERRTLCDQRVPPALAERGIVLRGFAGDLR